MAGKFIFVVFVVLVACVDGQDDDSLAGSFLSGENNVKNYKKKKVKKKIIIRIFIRRC